MEQYASTLRNHAHSLVLKDMTAAHCNNQHPAVPLLRPALEAIHAGVPVSVLVLVCAGWDAAMLQSCAQQERFISSLEGLQQSSAYRQHVK
jgi:hypothetical protein